MSDRSKNAVRARQGEVLPKDVTDDRVVELAPAPQPTFQEVARLRDENKRLREAGNDLVLAADSWNAHQTRSAFDRFSTAVDALRDALSAAQSRES